MGDTRITTSECPTPRFDLDPYPYGELQIGGIPPRNMARYDRAAMACAADALRQLSDGQKAATLTYTPIVSEEGVGIPGVGVGKDGKQVTNAVPAEPVQVAPEAPKTAPATKPKYPEPSK